MDRQVIIEQQKTYNLQLPESPSKTIYDEKKVQFMTIDGIQQLTKKGRDYLNGCIYGCQCSQMIESYLIDKVLKARNPMRLFTNIYNHSKKHSVDKKSFLDLCRYITSVILDLLKKAKYSSPPSETEPAYPNKVEPEFEEKIDTKATENSMQKFHVAQLSNNEYETLINTYTQSALYDSIFYEMMQLNPG